MTEEPAAKKLSARTLSRLPQYLRYLEALHLDEISHVTSAQLAAALGVSDALTRKDVSALGHSGRAGQGYGVEALRYTIARILGVASGQIGRASCRERVGTEGGAVVLQQEARTGR